jgi:hypothetical protein
MNVIIVKLKKILTTAAVERCLGVSFMLSFFLYTFLQTDAFDEPQSPDAFSGHLVPHEVKGRVVYITFIQDFFLTSSHYIAVTCFVLLLLRELLRRQK